MSTKKNEKKNKKQLTSKKGDIAKTVNKHPEVVRLKKEQVKELNEYLDKNRFYAYNDPKKFDEGMRMLGLNPEDTDKIVDVAGWAQPSRAICWRTLSSCSRPICCETSCPFPSSPA